VIKKVSVLLALCVLLTPVVAGAFDYKAWVPLLPKTLGDMAPSGDPDGVNVDMSGQKWSSVNQEYQSKDGRKTVELAVVAGQMAPQVQGFQGMVAMNMSMETDEQIMKTVTVSGKKGILVLDKQAKLGTLTIPVQQDMIVAITVEPASTPEDVTGLAQYLPLTQLGNAK